MPSATDTLVDRLEGATLEADAFEAERLRALVKARLLQEPSPETKIDRFVVLEPLGAGGMGIVYAAYDPKLDRKVAIKLVRASNAAARQDRQERLLGEARALARVSHPHVVAVYEVGLHGDAVFVAMEFVRGRTLREHIVAGRTPWRDAVRAYVQAAEGLAAAHAAGLVHRDFKPDNALVGDDGRVRVVDFGLAYAADDAGGGGPPVVAGTPAYMAPEQRLGLRVGPEGDQYALCASLHEGLCGVVPPIGVDAFELTALPTGLPQRLRRAIARGLAPLPADRFADMRALVDELRASTESTRRFVIPALLIATLGAGAGIAVASAMGGDDPCPDPVHELAGTWDPDRRDELRAVAARLGRTAPESVDVVVEELDAGTAAWRAGRVDACEALYVRRTESQARFDLRMGCLERSRRATTDLVDLLVEGDAASWAHAVEATLGLPRAEACRDPDALVLAGKMPDDPATLAGIERVREQVDRAETLGRLGRLDEAMQLAESTREAAMGLGHRATEALAILALGRLHDEEQRDVQATALFDDAAWRAEAAGADDLLLQILATEVACEADRGQLEVADRLALRVRGNLERVGGTPRTHAQVLRAQYMLAMAHSRFDEAEALAREGLELRVAQGEADSLDAARDLNNLGLVQYERAQFGAARETLAEALAIKQRWLGPRHPDVILARINLASVDEREGRTDAARIALESAIVDAEQALGPTPVVALALGNLANLHEQAGRPAEAIPLAERAVAVLEASVGPEDARLITPLNALGVAYGEMGRTADEQRCYERSLAIADRIDPDHPEKAYAWNNLAVIDRGRGDPAAAVEKSTRALALWRRVHGPDHPIAGQLGFSLAQAELELGANTDAATHAREAIIILARGGAVDAPALAGARFVLAQALWAVGTPDARTEALDHARAALAGDHWNPADRADIEAWIEKHRAP